MNITLPNSEKVEMIKGWPLDGARVKTIHLVKLNDKDLTVYATDLNFYAHLSGAWYNGGLITKSGTKVMTFLTSGANLKTSRNYEITAHDLDLEHLDYNDLNCDGDQGDGSMDSYDGDGEVPHKTKWSLGKKEEEVTASLHEEDAEPAFPSDSREDESPATPSISALTRVMKKEARAMQEAGVQIFAVKYNKKLDKYLEDTLSELSNFDDALEAYFDANKANKDNTHFMVISSKM